MTQPSPESQAQPCGSDGTAEPAARKAYRAPTLVHIGSTMLDTALGKDVGGDSVIVGSGTTP